MDSLAVLSYASVLIVQRRSISSLEYLWVGLAPVVRQTERMQSTSIAYGWYIPTHAEEQLGQILLPRNCSSSSAQAVPSRSDTDNVETIRACFLGRTQISASTRALRRGVPSTF